MALCFLALLYGLASNPPSCVTLPCVSFSVTPPSYFSRLLTSPGEDDAHKDLLLVIKE